MHNSPHLENLRHSVAHLLAAAVLQLFPGTKLTIGPPIEDGFYYDFEFENPISEHDFPKIETTMHKLVQSWKSFEKKEISIDDAKKIFAHNPYKLELIDEIAQKKEPMTLYTSGTFTDLCRGGHCENPSKELTHFKLLSVAGAYWRGSEKNTMLTRIYGTAFASEKELTDHLHMREEAKKRDHRKLGQELDLFFIDESVGKGLVMWLPNGTIVRDEIEKLVKEKEEEYGYQRVATPHIAREELYLRSGHLPYYKDSMYPGMQMDDATYYLKAMNCPHHHTIYNHVPRSYRELPLRLAEYGTCYRNELSGTLAGLLRVRGMTMNDAHIYIRKDQIKDEFKSVIRLTQEYFELFQLKDYWFRLSKWDPAHEEKYINEPENWQYSQQMIREVLQELGVPFKEVDDEAAFYGPKVDVQFRSVIGREETMSTIQLDFAAKKRFNLKYIDNEGKENNEVFVIHRAPLSVHERFMAFLLEHYAGNFPFWLTPEQVTLIPISDTHLSYAQEVCEALRTHGVRTKIDSASESMQKKIRRAQQRKVFFMAVVGDKEKSARTVSIRSRDGKNETLELDAFVQRAHDMKSTRTSQI